MESKSFSININKFTDNGRNNIIPKKFFKLSSDVLKLGYSKDVLFIKIIIKNISQQSIKKILYFDHLLTGHVDLLAGDKFIKGGSSVPLSKRNINSIFTAFKLNFGPMETKKIIIRKYGHHVLNSKIFISSPFDFYKVNTEKLNIFRFYAGAMLALFLYNLFIAILTKNKVYFIYCVYLISLFLTVVASQGVIDITDSFKDFTLSHYLIIFSSSTLIFSWYFAQSFLHTDKYIPWFKYIVKIGTVLSLVPILYALSPWFDSGAWLFGDYIDTLIPMGILTYIIAGVIISLKRQVLGYIYLLSWSFLFLGAFLYLGSVHGFLSRGYIYNNGLLFGNIFEMLILSLGLGYQITILNKEKDEALEKLKTKEKLQRLIRVLSHDIANSLQVLILNMKRALKSGDETTNLRIQNALRASDNITDILNHVRAEQRLEDATESIVCGKVNLKECIEEAIFLFQKKIENKALQLKENTSLDVMICTEKISIVNNVLGNILSNAIKFSPENGMITFNCLLEVDKVILEIRDQGHGFSEDVIQQFKKKSMIQSHSGTKGESGTGFGLRIIETYMSLYRDGKMEIFNDNGAVYKLSFKRS